MSLHCLTSFEQINQQIQENEVKAKEIDRLMVTAMRDLKMEKYISHNSQLDLRNTLGDNKEEKKSSEMVSQLKKSIEKLESWVNLSVVIQSEKLMAVNASDD